MVWIHNQGGARYQIVLLEDEKKFFVFLTYRFDYPTFWELTLNWPFLYFLYFQSQTQKSEISKIKTEETP